jgi:hypothetical protein
MMRMLLILIMLLGVVAGSAYPQEMPMAGQLAPTRGGPLHVNVDLQKLDLEQHGPDGTFASQPFHVRVGSVFPRWRLRVEGEIEMTPGSGSEVPVDDPRILLKPERALDDPTKEHRGGGLAVDAGAILALGGNTGGRVRQVNTFRLIVECDPLSPPGAYQGIIRILPDVPRRRALPEAARIDFEWNVVELLEVKVQQQALEFGTVGSEVTESLNQVTFMVHSNHRAAEIVVQMHPLQNQNTEGVLPESVTCIGYGPDPRSAQENARAAPLGQNEFRLTVGAGSHKFAIAGRAKLDFAPPVGQYVGQIVFTSQVTN